ncbi:MAG: allophanate hydrolase [Xanthobacteraceae bacterium]|nr:allophanate hydrolase [Xanthobacteraceae bacterium]
MNELPFDLDSLHRAYAAGLSPKVVVDTVFQRIAAAADPGIFIHLADREALAREAAALGPFDPVGKPLWGIPFAVKDNIDVAGMPTTAACPAFAYQAAEDATVVALLRQAGALVVGKTNLDQFATGLVGVRTPYPVPRNAVDPALVPGGSSSGSAVATALGIVSFALGTDTAGSGRVPAGLNNVVGLKPTFGALSAQGMVPACKSIDCISIFALTVDDAYRVYSVAARHDARDSYSRSVAVPPLGARPPALTVGVPARGDRRFFGDTIMEAGYDAALAQLQAMGCTLKELPFADFYAAAALLYEGAFVAERFAAVGDFMAAHEDALHPVTRTIIAGARKFSAADAFKGIYALQALRAKLAPLIAAVDLICVPTTPSYYSLAAVAAEPVAANSRLGTYTNFVNLLDMCGIAVPCGPLPKGPSMSVTLLAPAGQDALVAALGRDLHAASDLSLGATGWRLPPRAAAPAGNDTSIEIAVVGAHLSGMPLNRELTELGASFRRAAKTTAGYRLYALAGQQPPKPGLVRDAAGTGAIEVEVWSLSPDAFGRFVAAIPAPLCVGTVRLADGTAPKGFLVEAAGLADATDITETGGWRRYMAGSSAAMPA